MRRDAAAITLALSGVPFREQRPRDHAEIRLRRGAGRGAGGDAAVAPKDDAPILDDDLFANFDKATALDAGAAKVAARARAAPAAPQPVSVGDDFDFASYISNAGGGGGGGGGGGLFD